MGKFIISRGEKFFAPTKVVGDVMDTPSVVISVAKQSLPVVSP